MPNSIEEDVINNFYKKIQEICNTPIDELIKNRNASKGKNTLVYPEIKGSISELKSMLKYISKEGLEQLPIFRFMELRELINPYLDELHKISIQIKDGKTAEDSQKRNTIAIFLTPNRAGSFVKKRADIWKIIIETNTLLNSSLIDKNKIESMFSVLEGNLKQSNIFKEQIENIFKNTQEQSNKQTVNKHSYIFEKEAERNKYQSWAWLVCIILLMIINLKTILYFLDCIIYTDDSQNKIECGIFGAAIISMISS